MLRVTFDIYLSKLTETLSSASLVTTQISHHPAEEPLLGHVEMYVWSQCTYIYQCYAGVND